MRITDFGIARTINSVAITEVGQVIGTARYMSPEQARGEEATPASDVYSLAVVGYEMLSGDTPFAGDHPAAIALAHVQTPPPALPASVPAELRSLIERSLAKRPEDRPHDGGAFATALKGVAIDQWPTIVSPTGPIDPVTSLLRSPKGGMHPTAIFQTTPTFTDGAPVADVASTDVVPSVPSSTDPPLLGEGWLTSQRRRRRIAGWGTATAIARLFVLIAFDRGGNQAGSSATASTTSESTATPAPAVDLVAIDPATYRGLTEAQARAELSAAGLTSVTETGSSTADLLGVVIDVQPSGAIARGSTVTITLGDGIIAPVPDPPADDPGNEPGRGMGNGKGKGKDNGKD